jgi:hypothetical protein
VLVDLDCEDLELGPDRKRCDFLFVGEDERGAWVVPIELKSGGFSGTPVREQLQGGANAADGWIPPGCSFRFVPVLAYGRAGHREQIKSLRSGTVTLRDQHRKPVLIRCDARLTEALARVGRVG